MNTNDDTNMPGTITVTVRLSKEAKAKLDALAESTHRSKNYLAAEAMRIPGRSRPSRRP